MRVNFFRLMVDQFRDTLYMHCWIMPERTANMDIPGIPDPQLLSRFCGQHGISLLLLFGSRAKGAERPDSDFDLAVLRDPGANEEGNLLTEIMFLFGTGLVHLVDLRHGDPLLNYHIAHDGLVLYEDEPGRFARFAVRALQDHEDARKFFEAEARFLENIVRGGSSRVRSTNRPAETDQAPGIPG